MPSAYRRLHVIVGDSNMSEYTAFLKVGACGLLLRMLEEPSVQLRDMTLENPIRAIREISHDPTCRRTVRLANGRELTALDMQTEFLERALRFAEHRDMSPEETMVLEMWQHCLEGLAGDPMDLAAECDWVAKRHLIDGYMERHNLPLSDPAVALVDLQYHDVDRRRASSTACRTGGS